jgi:enoyl-CoA hydratase
MGTALVVEYRPPVAELRLALGARGGAIDAEVVEALARACGELHDRDDVSAVVLTSEGADFGRGGEVPLTADGEPAFRCVELAPQPVIAVVQGEVSGAALELALACDVRVAAADARFSMPDIGAGRMPAGGATQRLPRLVGRAFASELLLLGTTFDAETALRIGLVNAVAADAAAARARAETLAARVAERGPLAVRYAKEAMLRGLDMPLEQALRYETDLTVLLQTTADRAEGVRAFLEKRRPEFRGE